MTDQPQHVPVDEPTGSGQTPDRSESDSNRRRRIASAALGGALLTLGLRRRSLGGTAAASVGGWLLYRGLGGGVHLPQTLDPHAAADRRRPEAGAPADATEVERSLTIGKSADELYRFWRDPQNLARIVGHVAEVTPTSEERQHWVVHGPAGRSVSWDARIVEERPGELLRWESTEGAVLPNEGSVRFRPAPGDRGTEVTLRVRFDPPGGALGDAAVRLSDVVPDALAGSALRRFKSLAETGEIPTLERNPSARGSGDRI